MVRWIRQRNCSSCGPVALLNLQKWAGFDISYDKDYGRWKSICHCTRRGTDLLDFRAGLYRIPCLTLFPQKRPTVQNIDRELRRGRCVVLKSAIKDRDGVTGHYFLVADRTPKSFFCVNVEFKHCWVRKPEFRELYLQQHPEYKEDYGYTPFAWFVERRKWPNASLTTDSTSWTKLA